MSSDANEIALHLGWSSLLVIVLLYMNKRLASNRRFKACQRSLLAEDNLADHRIDAARREAEHGFLPCPSCGFENFTRSQCCAICGALCFDTGPDQGYLLPSTSDLTTTQRRARLRKEWQRKVDVEGRLFWFRNAIDDIKRSFPGVVVRLQPIVDDDNDECLAHNKTEGASVSLILIDSGDADAADFAIGSAELSDVDDRQRILQLASSDFPSKYSQFIVNTAISLRIENTRRLRVSLRRDYLLEQSIESLCCLGSVDIRGTLRINFLGECGVDAGGLHREWFMILNELLIAPSVGLFTCTSRSDQTYYINANPSGAISQDQEHYYYGAGRLVGRALLDGATLGFHFCVPLLKLILGMPVSFEDMEYYDAVVYKNLIWIAENNVDNLGLDFSLCEEHDGRMVVVDLIPNGRDIPVTNANKALYLERRFKHTLFESVGTQLYSFLRGVYEVIPQTLLLPLDYEELDYLLCGTNEIDVDDWERNTRTSLTLEDYPRALRWFWQLVREMDNEYRRRLLHFATGCSRVPLVGFKGLTSYDGRLCPFTLKGVPYVTDKYIRSHACFNLIELPLFRTKNEMKTALLATLDTDVYGFTTV